MAKMTRGLDHLVIAVHDLAAAEAAYRQAGFTTTPVAHHPWGTSNFLVQLDRFFLEIIAVTDASRLLPRTERQFSFGSYLQDFLKEREGLAMTVFESFDATADRDEFAAKKISDFDRFDFEREATLPDGSKAIVGFSLAFVAPLEMPKVVFFTCQQHAPQYFWKPDYQKHANGSLGIGAVAMVIDDPVAARPLMAALQDSDSVLTDGDGLHVGTARGWIDVLTPDSAQSWYGSTAIGDGGDGPRFFGARIAVQDMAATEDHLNVNSVPYTWQRAGLQIDSGFLHGMTLAFVQAPEST